MVAFEAIKMNLGSGRFTEIIKYGVIASVVSLLVSVSIDTYFWGLQYDIRYRTDPK